MRVLILGAAGMLGHKLCQLFCARFDTWATVRSSYRQLAGCGVLPAERCLEGVDAAGLDSVERALAKVRPDAVINCVGIIKQLRDAKDPIACLTINSLFPHRLAELCRAGGARLVHISTDCVFSGRKGRYRESDPSDAEDLYGRSKFLGEVEGPGCLTLRTSIIGRELNSSSGLIEWFLSKRGGLVRGFRRAIYSGFTTRALGAIIGDVLQRHPNLEGLYQVASEPISKYDLLNLVNDVYRLAIQVEPDSDFVCDRSLDSSRFRAAVGFQPPTWPEMIDDMFHDSALYDNRVST